MARQADAEIEVTPEMLTAGVCELLNYDKYEDNPRLTARWIFEAMVAAAKSPRIGRG